VTFNVEVVFAGPALMMTKGHYGAVGSLASSVAKLERRVQKTKIAFQDATSVSMASVFPTIDEYVWKVLQVNIQKAHSVDANFREHMGLGRCSE
jgi:hypothetical protein